METCQKCGGEHPEMVPFRKTSIHVVQGVSKNSAGEAQASLPRVTVWEGMAPYVCVPLNAESKAALDKAFESGKVVER